jgi:hypothetical protein
MTPLCFLFRIKTHTESVSPSHPCETSHLVTEEGGFCSLGRFRGELENGPLLGNYYHCPFGHDLVKDLALLYSFMS